MEDQRNDQSGWYSIVDLHEKTGDSVSTVRSKLKRELERYPKNQHQRLVRAGEGSRGHLYGAELVRKVYPGLTKLQTQSIDGLIERCAKQFSKGAPFVLPPRRDRPEVYEKILRDLISCPGILLIRGISAKDVLRPDNGIDQHLRHRKAPTKVLLLFPYGQAAAVRTVAEESPDLARSQLFLDSVSATTFFEHRKDFQDLAPKWMDHMPDSFMVWNESGALVEFYDFAKPEDDGLDQCIGGYAPMFYAKGGTNYHEHLKRGFDYVFDGNDIGFRVCNLNDVLEHQRNLTVNGPPGNRPNPTPRDGKS